MSASAALQGEENIHAASRVVAGPGAGFNDNDEDGSDWGGVALLSSEGESEQLSTEGESSEDDTPAKRKGSTTGAQASVIKNETSAVQTAKQTSEGLLAVTLKAEASVQVALMKNV